MSDDGDTAVMEQPATDLPEVAPSPAVRPFLLLDASAVVIQAGSSNLLPDGAMEVDAAVAAAALRKVGLCTFTDGALVDYAPPAAPDPLPVAVPKTGLVRALMARGDWRKVKALIASSEDTQDLWDATSNVELADPLTQGIIQAMAYDDATVRAIMLVALAA